jgi:hypothetical protein
MESQPGDTYSIRVLPVVTHKRHPADRKVHCAPKDLGAAPRGEAGAPESRSLGAKPPRFPALNSASALVRAWGCTLTRFRSSTN